MGRDETDRESIIAGLKRTSCVPVLVNELHVFLPPRTHHSRADFVCTAVHSAGLDTSARRLALRGLKHRTVRSTAK